MATEFSGKVDVDLDDKQREYLNLVLHRALTQGIFELTGKTITADQIQVNSA